MRPRDKSGGKAVKKRRDAPKAARHRRPSAADANEKIALLERRLNEAVEQQTATSEVLKVISRSPGELGPVFQTMLENAVRICGAKFGMLYLSEDEGFRTVAMYDVPRAFAEKRDREPLVFPPAADSPLGRIIRTRQVARVADVRTESGYTASQALRDLADLGGARTIVAVPMLKDNELAGAIVIFRQEVRPFGDKQIELVQNFASQAVIAIENTRLVNELRQRTDDLSDALERQTAMSEVLGVIAKSSGALNPIFQSMLGNALRLCDAKFGVMFGYKNSGIQVLAVRNVPAKLAKYLELAGFGSAKDWNDARTTRANKTCDSRRRCLSRGHLVESDRSSCRCANVFGCSDVEGPRLDWSYFNISSGSTTVYRKAN